MHTYKLFDLIHGFFITESDYIVINYIFIVFGFWWRVCFTLLFSRLSSLSSLLFCHGFCRYPKCKSINTCKYSERAGCKKRVVSKRYNNISIPYMVRKSIQTSTNLIFFVFLAVFTRMIAHHIPYDLNLAFLSIIYHTVTRLSIFFCFPTLFYELFSCVCGFCLFSVLLVLLLLLLTHLH